jgi:hypothetical protein
MLYKHTALNKEQIRENNDEFFDTFRELENLERYSNTPIELYQHRYLLGMFSNITPFKMRDYNAAYNEGNHRTVKDAFNNSPKGTINVSLWIADGYGSKPFKEIPTEDKLLSGSLMLDATHSVRTFKYDDGLIVLVNKITVEFITKFICVLPKIFPELLPAVPVLKQFLSLDYAGMVASMVHMHDNKEVIARTNKIKEWVDTISNVATCPEAVNLEASITAAKQSIEYLNNELRSAIRTAQSKQNELLVMLANPFEVDTAVETMFLKNKYITYFNFEGGKKLHIQLRVPVSDYDPHQVEILINSQRQNDLNKSKRNKVLAKAIFLDNKYTLYYEERWIFNFETFEAGCVSDRTQHSRLATRNPHIDQYACYTSYKGYIMNAMKSRDYVNMLAYASTCVGSVNFADPPVIKHVFGYMLDRLKTNTMLTDMEGNPVTPEQILAKETKAYEVFENEQKAAQQTDG